MVKTKLSFADQGIANTGMGCVQGKRIWDSGI